MCKNKRLGGVIIKHKIFLTVLSVLLIVMLIAPVACVGKKTTTPASTDTQLRPDVTALQTKVASLIDTVSNLDTPPNYKPNIDTLDLQVIDFETRIAELEASVGSENAGTLNIPQYALVTGISHRYIAVTVYGTGDFPVLVYLYGEDLEATNVPGSEDWVVEAVEYREYDVVDVFLYGRAISTDTIPVTVPGQTTVLNDPLKDDSGPINHTHDVPPQIINVPSAAMGDTGTLMVVVVEPDDEWTNGYEFEIDIQGIDDNNGWVDYATASIGVRN